MRDLRNVHKQQVCSFLVKHVTCEPRKPLAEKDWFIHHYLLRSFLPTSSNALVSLAVPNTNENSKVSTS